MKKIDLIKKINAIIEEYGSFSTGEVMADHSPCINSQGNIVSLAEYFDVDSADIEVYDGASSSSDSISSYTEKYENMSKAVLEEILELANQYKESQEE
jgi:hypothetical protein